MLSLRVIIPACLVFLTATSAFCHAVRQNAKLWYDKKNWVKFEDLGREETTYTLPGQKDVYWAIRFGDSVRLHAMVDGSTKAIDLKKDYENAAIDSQVEEIRYADKHHLWIMSRLGRMMDGAVLVDLKEAKIEKSFCGHTFRVSPNGRHILYAHPTGRETADVYLDGTTRLYPNVEDGFELAAVYGPQKKEDRTTSTSGAPVEARWKSSTEAEWVAEIMVPGDDNEWRGTDRYVHCTAKLRKGRLPEVTQKEIGPIEMYEFSAQVHPEWRREAEKRKKEYREKQKRTSGDD